MKTTQHLTIEDRLNQIELVLNEIKILLLKRPTQKVASPEIIEEKLMNVKEVAKFINSEAAAVYSACANKQLKFIRIGKQYKFKREDVLSWLENKRKVEISEVDDYVNKYLANNVLRG